MAITLLLCFASFLFGCTLSTLYEQSKKQTKPISTHTHKFDQIRYYVEETEHQTIVTVLSKCNECGYVKEVVLYK